MTKYDDASWHYGGDFPAGLPRTAAATHIGMFLAWCVSAALASPDFTEDAAEELALLTTRQTTPGAFLLALDEKLVDDQLDDEGNAFASAYYAAPDEETGYLDDYVDVFEEVDEIYAVGDTWGNFDRLAPRIRSRFEAWRAAR